MQTSNEALLGAGLNAEIPAALNSLTNLAQSATPTPGTKITTEYGHDVFVKADGTLSRNEWILGEEGWYHTADNGVIDSGWVKIENGWFYFNQTSDKKGVMHVGWLGATTSKGDNHIFHFSANGIMSTGYQIIDGETFFFSPVETDSNPLGSLVVNQVTPDGRFAGPDGRVK